jgi:hypothetical protein
MTFSFSSPKLILNPMVYPHDAESVLMPNQRNHGIFRSGDV